MPLRKKLLSLAAFFGLALASPATQADVNVYIAEPGLNFPGDGLAVNPWHVNVTGIVDQSNYVNGNFTLSGTGLTGNGVLGLQFEIGTDRTPLFTQIDTGMLIDPARPGVVSDTVTIDEIAGSPTFFVSIYDGNPFQSVINGKAELPGYVDLVDIFNDDSSYTHIWLYSAPENVAALPTPSSLELLGLFLASSLLLSLMRRKTSFDQSATI